MKKQSLSSEIVAAVLNWQAAIQDQAAQYNSSPKKWSDAVARSRNKRDVLRQLLLDDPPNPPEKETEAPPKTRAQRILEED